MIRGKTPSNASKYATVSTSFSRNHYFRCVCTAPLGLEKIVSDIRLKGFVIKSNNITLLPHTVCVRAYNKSEAVGLVWEVSPTPCGSMLGG